MDHELRRLIDAPGFQEYHRESRQREFNTFDVLRYSDYEIRHSNVLAWLLQPCRNPRSRRSLPATVRGPRQRPAMGGERGISSHTQPRGDERLRRERTGLCRHHHPLPERAVFGRHREQDGADIFQPLGPGQALP